MGTYRTIYVRGKYHCTPTRLPVSARPPPPPIAVSHVTSIKAIELLPESVVLFKTSNDKYLAPLATPPVQTPLRSGEIKTSGYMRSDQSIDHWRKVIGSDQRGQLNPTTLHLRIAFSFFFTLLK